MAKTTKTDDAPTTEPNAAELPQVDLSSLEGLSPLEQIQALSAQLKTLKSDAGEAMKADATAKFTPLYEQLQSAVTAMGDGENPERAAAALKWIGENMAEIKRAGRTYHKYVFGVAAPRKPREPKSDVSAEGSEADAA